jgi:hypothetical protein
MILGKYNEFVAVVRFDNFYKVVKSNQDGLWLAKK